MYISNETVNKIIETAQIVDVVQDFVNLKRRGVNFLGNCPFHNEKTPSFTVSPAKGIFKCFGCGKAGNSVGFIMEHEQLSYPEALKYLARKYNIEVEEETFTAEQVAQKNKRESMMLVASFAQKYFTNILHNDKEGKTIAYSYFKERGFSKESIDKFQLGYSPENRTAFTEHALQQGYKLEYLTATGLTVDKNNYRFDRFAGRVIFPIHSLSGNVIGFGGRILKNNVKTAKYLNSPESELYHKSNILYGIYHAKREIIKQDKCYMVEGYTDVISFSQAGIENVVASSGTSLTENQIRLVKRFTENLTVIYDGDAAGIKASFRGIDLILEQAMNVKVVMLPDGEDPDSFSKNLSNSELKQFINDNEVDFISFKTSLLLEDAKNDPVQKARLISDIVRSISLIPNSITRSVYIKECSNLLDVKEDALYSEANKVIFKRKENERKKSFSQSNNQIKQSQSTPIPSFVDEVFAEVNEKELVSLLMTYGNEELFRESDEDAFSERVVTVAEYIINEILNDDLEFKNLIYKQIFEEYNILFKNNEVPDEKFFIHHQDDGIRTLAANIFSDTYKTSAIWTKGGKHINSPKATLKTDVPKAINSYKLKIIQQAIKDNENQIKNAKADDFELVKTLLEQKISLNKIKAELAKETGKRIIF